MEYKKDTEKFAVGFGSENGLDDEEIKKIKSAVEKKDGSSSGEDLLEAVLGIAALAGMTLFKLKFGSKKSRKQKKAEKKAEKKRQRSKK
ncbi:MAG: hypothetical protein NC093_09610 [Alistipes sp.]|nr:hypothetical protein [Alistipes sp.]